VQRSSVARRLPLSPVCSRRATSLLCSRAACSFGWWLMAGADLFWDKSTAGWLLVAGLLWEKSTAGWWLISQANRAVVGSVIAAAPLIWSSLQIPCRGNGSCRTCIRVLESHAVHSEIRITFAPLPSSSMSLPLHSGEEDERHELQGRQGPRQAQLASRSLLPSNWSLSQIKECWPQHRLGIHHRLGGRRQTTRAASGVENPGWSVKTEEISNYEYNYWIIPANRGLGVQYTSYHSLVV
jgi:hypothetical protein